MIEKDKYYYVNESCFVAINAGAAVPSRETTLLKYIKGDVIRGQFMEMVGMKFIID